ncbi:MAG: TRAP transporter small permease subunit [Deinococcales bacterium]
MTESVSTGRGGLELILLRLSQALAMLGGLVLIALTFITVYSIIGRSIVKTPWLRDIDLINWWRPIRGDFELIEIGTAIAIFSFLPYCQMVRGNVIVDFFTIRTHPKVKAALALFANLIFLLLCTLLTWRMMVGTHEYFSATFKQSSMLLKIPIWQPMALATGFMSFLTLVCLFTVYRSAREMFGQGEPLGVSA